MFKTILLLAYLFSVQAQNNLDKEYPTCYVSKADRKPCTGDSKISKNRCISLGCCYNTHELTGENEHRCYQRVYTKQDHCKAGLRKRVPCLSWKASKKACHEVGCCWDHRSLPTCYHNVGFHYNIDTSYHKVKFPNQLPATTLAPKTEKPEPAQERKVVVVPLTYSLAPPPQGLAASSAAPATIEKPTLPPPPKPLPNPSIPPASSPAPASIPETEAPAYSPPPPADLDIKPPASSPPPPMTIPQTPSPSPIPIDMTSSSPPASSPPASSPPPKLKTKNRVCVTGERTIANGEVIADNLVETICGSPDHHCWKESYEMLYNNVLIRQESGHCVKLDQMYTCEDIIKYGKRQNYPEFFNCEIDSCDISDLCTDLQVTPPAYCPATAKDDLQLFPGCTMNELLEKTMLCVALYLGESPHSNKTECRSKVEAMLICQAKVFNKCFDGVCPTVLDDVPGLRSEYGKFRELTKDLSGVQELDLRFVHMYYLREVGDFSSTIDQIFCPEDATSNEDMWYYLSMIQPVVNFVFSLFGISSQMPDLTQLIPCDEEFFAKMSEPLHQAIIKFTQDGNHDEFCETYDGFMSALSDLRSQHCQGSNEEKVQQIKNNVKVSHKHAQAFVKAIDILGEFVSKNPRLPRCDAIRTCITGERVMMDSQVLSDTTYKTPCTYGFDFCVKETYNIAVDGAKVSIEGGGCIHPQGVYTCDNVHHWTQQFGPGQISDCKMRFCNGDLCASLATPEPDQCKIKENDLQVLPGCSLNDLLDMMMVCTSPFIAQLPFTDNNTCSKTLEVMLGCITQVVNYCLEGRCPTVVDDQPGVRASYPTIRLLTDNLGSYEEFLTRIEHLQLIQLSEYVQDAHSMFCSDEFDIEKWMHGADLGHEVQHLLSTFGVYLNIPSFKEFLPCKPGAFASLMKIFREHLTSFGAATNHQQMCRTYESMVNDIESFVESSCDMGNDNDERVKSFRILYEFFQRNKKLAACDKERVCVTGERSTVGGSIVSDNTFKTTCNHKNHLCAVQQYSLLIPEDDADVEVYVESGQCFDPNKPYTCDEIRSYSEERGYGTITDCDIEICTGNLCTSLKTNTTENEKECENPEKDIQLFPDCTLSDSAGLVAYCVSPYISNMPYEDNQLCRERADEMVSCLTESLTSCMYGTCPTILDQIVGLRSAFPLLREITVDIHSVEELASRLELLSLEKAAKGVTYETLCPSTPVQVELNVEYLSKDPFQIIEEILNSLHIDAELPEFSSWFPCNENFANRFKTLQASLVRSVGTAVTKQQICRAYQDFTSTLSLEERANCVDDTTDVTAFKIMKQFNDNVSTLPGCDNRRRCVTGKKESIGGATISDNRVATLCATSTSLCTSENYDLELKNYTVSIENGECVEPFETYDCDDIYDYLQFVGFQGKFSNCMVESCGGDLCSTVAAIPPENCRKPKDKSDIPLFPSCTMRESLDIVYVCLAPFLSNVPHQNDSQCYMDVEHLVGCIAHTGSYCLKGRCPTVLDDLAGFRSSYSIVRELFRNFQGMEDLSLKFEVFGMGDISEILEALPTFFCSDKSNITAEDEDQFFDFSVMGLVGKALEFFTEDESAIEKLLPCESEFYEQLKLFDSTAMNDFFKAKDHQEVCSIYDRVSREVTNLIKTGCQSLQPQMMINLERRYGATRERSSVVQKALVMIERFFQRNPRLPNCDESRTCVTGELSMLGKYVISDNRAETVCSSGNQICMFEEYDLTTKENVTVRVESGSCMDPQKAYLCDELESYNSARGYGKVSNCRMEICGADSCSRMQKPNREKCPKPSPKDLPVFPSCTLQQLLDSSVKCVSSHISGFPYSKQETCKENADELIACLANVAYKCLSGYCPTILDHFPGVRSSYSMLRELKYEVKSVADYVERLKLMGMNKAAEVMESAYDVLCPTGDMVDVVMKSLQTPDFVGVMKKFLYLHGIKTQLDSSSCSEKVSSYEATQEFDVEIAASTPYCRAMQDFSNNIHKALGAGCFSSTGDEKEQKAVKTAMRIFKSFSEDIPSTCPFGKKKGERPVCLSGERVKAGDFVVSDYLFPSICSNPDDECLLSKIKQIAGENILDVEMTACSSYNNYRGIGCSLMQSGYSYFGIETRDCYETRCKGDLCFSIEDIKPVGCNKPQNDIQLLPKCTMRETLDMMLVCLSPYLSSLPFENNNMCKETVNGMVQCFSKVFTACFNGKCPTVLDDIPGLRDHFMLIRGVFYEKTTVDDIIDYLNAMGAEDGAKLFASMMPTMCPENDEKSAANSYWLKQLDLLEILEDFLESFGIEVSMPKIKDILPCKPSFMPFITTMQKRMYNSINEASSHQDICRAYDFFSRSFKLMYSQQCAKSSVFDEKRFKEAYPSLARYSDHFETAMNVLSEFLSDNPRMLKCDEKPRKCVIGEKVSVFGTVTEDNTFEAECAKDNFLCMSESYVLQLEQTPVIVSAGKCIDAHRAYICEDVNEYLTSANIGSVQNCTISVCSSDLCAPITATPAENCVEKDIAFLPDCSVSEYLNKLQPCVSEFFAALPYSDNTACLTNLDVMISCVAKATHPCLLGRCPTLLDGIPGLRASYQELRELLYDSSGIDDMVLRLKGRYYLEAAEYVGKAKSMICHLPDAQLQVLSGWQNQGSFLEMLDKMLKTFGVYVDMPENTQILPCSDQFFDAAAQAGKTALQEFVSATNHQQVCNAYSKFFTSVSNLVLENCENDLDAITNHIMENQQSYLDSVPARKTAEALVQFWTFFQSNPSIPNCD